MRGTAHYRGEEQRVYTLRAKGIFLTTARNSPPKEKGIYLSNGSYITSVPMLYYFQANVILLSSESYITFPQKLYYFSPQPIGATDEGSIEPP